MTTPPGKEPDSAADALTARLDELLRQLPLQRAPEALAMQVMASIQQRATQRGFQRWPLAARIVFIVMSGVMAKLAVDASIWALQSLGSVIAAPRPPFIAMLAEVAMAVSKSLPALWMYGAIALLTLIYGGLFGISTAMYRTLYEQR